MKNRKKDVFQSVVVLLFSLSVAQGGRVTQITPTTGSLLGATTLTIHGEGFAQNQFNEFEKELGNNVTLVSLSRAHVVPCDVILYYTTPYRIVCQTRPSPSGEDSYNVRVSVDGKWLHNTDKNVYCGGECLFKYSETKTATITSITPKYGLPGECTMR